MGRLTAAPSLLTPARSSAPANVRRASARERGYIARWDRESKAFLRANPLCIGCLAEGLTVPSALTDHVIPHKGDERLFWKTGNWQAACDWHHNVVKQILERQFANGQILAEDLRLDSEIALDLARVERARGGGSKV